MVEYIDEIGARVEALVIKLYDGLTTASCRSISISSLAYTSSQLDTTTRAGDASKARKVSRLALNPSLTGKCKTLLQPPQHFNTIL